MSLSDLDPAQFSELAQRTRQQYDELKARNLNLDLTRGKPSSEQLGFSNALLSLPGEGDYTDNTGADVRNYGGLTGIPDIRELWAEALGIDPDNLIAGDSSSLNIMFDLISWSYIWGNNDSPRPWKDEETVKWICPVPGYDRHFSITEHFGFEMVQVPMTSTGPDMDAVEELVKDPQVKGMWTVPVFGNPTGVTFAPEVVEKLAAMETAAPDFRIVWDNAYAIHTLTGAQTDNPDVIALAEKHGNPNRFWYMSSTSKITLAGSGVAFFASSKANLEWYASHASIRGIGPNKVNQLAHARLLGDVQGLHTLMKQHASSLAPKFEAVVGILQDRLGEFGVTQWTEPEGGYFISLDVLDGSATRVWELAKDAGITLTKAGASFPHGVDEKDQNIRLAPSLPPLDEVRTAMDGVATCVLLACVEAAEAQAG
ncbi:aminotransferase class I/II-fold pyridoxal phosphate-dependent enzyme [Corynebacterium haemomassiliense]|uniref:Aminotransferase class I/II-fold pyridoxal phosphate-dependent enzyme n=1 Tax=Corynebacterium haemomassiliense TaxID=2754726 RepID=A0A7W2I4A6_9CORY|nr:aminotransferase class I/II-fold pyridoxal phosphate-dependent enzyme [Corynebacterium haemomassiliense]MBA5244982.1 aminotransferase class I/II-fold pyridoxal phosphate-dependent enzyme [Corynebacterium haemomassiliense]